MRESIGPIKKPQDPALENWEKELDRKIEASGELRARIESIKSQTLDDKDFQEMIDTWNQAYAPLGGYYVEKTFSGARGRTLQVMMDRAGNIHLGFRIETRE